MSALAKHRRRSSALTDAPTPEADSIRLSPAQALAAEVLLVDASLETGEEFSAVEVDPEDWQRLVDMARKVGGT